jgi:AhpD family alkylhydroperoxidase
MMFVVLYYAMLEIVSMSAESRIPYARFNELAAPARLALLALGKSVDEAGLDKGLTELVKVRVSQMNGCAFCLAMHLDIARKVHVPASKLDLVCVWQEAAVFDARERAALAWAEALTRPNPGANLDALFAQVRAEFSEAEAAFLTVAIGTINQWNRIAGGLGFAPLPAKTGG